MNYGKPEDWTEWVVKPTMCGKCDNNASWIWGERICVLCNDCYQKLVVTPKLKPLTKNDLTDELVGKEVVCLDNTRYKLAETTHSCTLEFPNGETVTIPGPSGPEWAAETTQFDWPVVYNKVLSTTDRIKMHKEGSLVFHEYLGMLNREILKVRSITKWTRDPNYQPPEREETFEERAIRRYPSRLRG